jgi:hypothetical protein
MSWLEEVTLSKNRWNVRILVDAMLNFHPTEGCNDSGVALAARVGVIAGPWDHYSS